MSGFRYRHERMDVYQVSVQFVEYVAQLESNWFDRRSDRRNQLERSADSVPLNVAEGLAQQSRGMRDKHLKIALGSAAECQAVLDLLRIKGHETRHGLALLARIGAMLSRMLQ